MSYKSLVKSVRFISNYRQILSSSSYVFSHHKFKFYVERKPDFLLFANFCTSVNHSSDESRDKDEYFVKMTDNKRLAKHEDDPDMPIVKLTFVTKDGDEIPVEARVGNVVMKVAQKYNEDSKNTKKIPMEYACEGQKACTTCHCYIDLDDSDNFTQPDIDEDDLIETAPFNKETSRLGCQLRIIKQFDNVRIVLPSVTVNFYVDKS